MNGTPLSPACLEFAAAPEPQLFDSTLNIGYVSGIQEIFDNSCISCHNGSQAPDLTDSNSYQALLDGDYIDTLSVDYESSELYQALKSSLFSNLINTVRV